MAKKKKSTKKKSTRAAKAAPAPEITERSPFWGYSGAVLLIIIALFLLLGGFGTGGPLPTGLFNASHWLFGAAAWLTPVALVYWGVYKFRADDQRLPLSNFFS